VNPQSGPKTPSAENQKRAIPGRKSSFFSRGTALEARNSGSRLSHGLKVK
jgi:hypothetical protein